MKQTGLLSVAEGLPYKARADFEEALMHYANHAAAIVGLSNILLDIYAEVLSPVPAIPGIAEPDGQPINIDETTANHDGLALRPKSVLALPALPLGPLGLGEVTGSPATPKQQPPTRSLSTEELPAPYKAKSLPLVDRLAARDRAYGLLSGLTRLGSGWNDSDAWFALARAHEESGQLEKAKEALWWCVELEEGRGIRDWNSVGAGRYVL